MPEAESQVPRSVIEAVYKHAANDRDGGHGRSVDDARAAAARRVSLQTWEHASAGERFNQDMYWIGGALRWGLWNIVGGDVASGNAEARNARVRELSNLEWGWNPVVWIGRVVQASARHTFEKTAPGRVARGLLDTQTAEAINQTLQDLAPSVAVNVVRANGRREDSRETFGSHSGLHEGSTVHAVDLTQNPDSIARMLIGPTNRLDRMAYRGNYIINKEIPVNINALRRVARGQDAEFQPDYRITDDGTTVVRLLQRDKKLGIIYCFEVSLDQDALLRSGGVAARPLTRKEKKRMDAKIVRTLNEPVRPRPKDFTGSNKGDAYLVARDENAAAQTFPPEFITKEELAKGYRVVAVFDERGLLAANHPEPDQIDSLPVYIVKARMPEDKDFARVVGILNLDAQMRALYGGSLDISGCIERLEYAALRTTEDVLQSLVRQTDAEASKAIKTFASFFHPRKDQPNREEANEVRDEVAIILQDFNDDAHRHPDQVDTLIEQAAKDINEIAPKASADAATFNIKIIKVENFPGKGSPREAVRTNPRRQRRPRG